MKAIAEDYFNAWLKYHNTNTEQVKKDHPEWDLKRDSHKFYKTYAVTQQQHDEWYEWAIKQVMKDYKMSRKIAEKEFQFPYLNLAPSIIKED
jgi:spore coat polysaccharide biosynthesis protein SpsF (cytidylyltransferase family)